MNKCIGNMCSKCRAEGQKLFLKNTRCYSGKCAFARRSSSPGQRGQSHKRSSEFGLQIRAKQRAKRYYGILEKQFKGYYSDATRIHGGKVGEDMLSILERRLDNIVYRLGWVLSRAQARQFISSGGVYINGHQVKSPSIVCDLGNSLAISPNARSSSVVKDLVNSNLSKPIPKWVEFSSEDHFEAKIVAIPTREDIDLDVEETLIVELYSK